MRRSRTVAIGYGERMASSPLALVPVERIHLQTTNEDIPEDVRRRLDPDAHHQLRMAQATERVIAMVPIPEPLDGVQQALTALLDTAIAARATADMLAQPLRLRRPVHPGASWSAAENAAQSAAQAYKVELAQSWPVAEWSDALTAIARVAAQEGAWELLGWVVRGLEQNAGSVEWWDAVLHIEGLWGGRNYQQSDRVVGELVEHALQSARLPVG